MFLLKFINFYLYLFTKLIYLSENKNIQAAKNLFKYKLSFSYT